ncbi:MAG: hypothetical protein J6K66_06950 [Clostridia bacterium]|nr:hypothetical protein [Clostridia bacterium]
MIKQKRIFMILTALVMLLSVCSCKKASPGSSYLKENAGGTGYGAGIKSSLYIEDFYFITVGTQKSAVELTLGMPHYTEEGNAFYSVYDLNNGDSIEFSFDKDKNAVTNAEYVYADGDKQNFFDILVELGILKSSVSESGGGTTVEIPGGEDNKPSVDTPDNTQTPDNTDKPDNSQTPGGGHNAVQGDQFASGSYNYILIEPVLGLGVPRSSILSAVGKPSYFFSHSFANDSYIIDCYNLNDGSKLYLDYGYARDNLRSAAIYKNGSYTSVLNAQWTEQVKPAGFTRNTVDKNKLGRLKKNMTPAQVYKSLGEPAWYEGTRGSYSDVFALPGGEYAYLSFGSAHNRLTSLSIKGADGKVTAVTLN